MRCPLIIGNLAKFGHRYSDNWRDKTIEPRPAAVALRSIFSETSFL